MAGGTAKSGFGSGQKAVAGQHPWWCDQNRCTADPTATTLAGFGEHLSALIEVDLDRTWSGEVAPGRYGAFLSQAGPPWPCEPFLRVHGADLRVCVPVRSAVPVLKGLLALCAMAESEVRP